MTANRTFSMIKPDALKEGHAGSILKIIEENGFQIVALKTVQLTKEQAGQFYAVPPLPPVSEPTPFSGLGWT